MSSETSGNDLIYAMYESTFVHLLEEETEPVRISELTARMQEQYSKLTDLQVFMMVTTLERRNVLSVAWWGTEECVYHSVCALTTNKIAMQKLRSQTQPWLVETIDSMERKANV